MRRYPHRAIFRKPLTVVFCFLAFSCAFPLRAADPPPSVQMVRQLSDALAWSADRVKRSTVVVITEVQGRTSLDSGVIIDPDGYIITSYDIVKNRKTVQVRIPTDRNNAYEARVLGSDPLTELALIKIDAKNLPAAKLGNSDNVRVGDWVIAVGIPLGLAHTVSVGIISATNRARGTGNVVRTLQTDAAINPGSMGGPLASIDGEVIAINSALTSKSGWFEGVGYAVPINIVRQILPDLKAGRTPQLPSVIAAAPRPVAAQPTNTPAKKADFGAITLDLDDATAKENKLTSTRGAVIIAVRGDSAADKAGLQAGDIIVAFDNRMLDSAATLKLMLDSARPGAVVPLKIVREGQPLIMEVELGEQK